MIRLVAAVTLLLALCLPVSATTYLVTPSGTGDYATIQDAINAAADGDIIELADGTFTGSGNRNILYMGKAITVASQSGNPSACVIDCQGQGRGFYFHYAETAASVLRGITITNGHAGQGGAISCINGNPSVTDCRFSHNSAHDEGGAVYCYWNGDASFQNCTFVGNSGDAGGGMYSMYSSPVLVACTFHDNEAMGGGALCLTGSPIVASGCDFTDNRAHVGGGVLVDFSSSVFTNCLFSGNSSSTGGGMCVANGGTTLETCVFMGNSAYSKGGGLYSDFPLETSYTVFAGNAASRGGGIYGFGLFDHCTICGNTASEGAGMYVQTTRDCTLRNTIIAFNAVGDAVRDIEQSTWLVCCDIYGNAGGDWVGGIAWMQGINDNLCANPRFCKSPQLRDAQNGDYRLWSTSPCVDDACGVIGALGIGCWEQPRVGAFAEAAGGDPSTVLVASPNPAGSATALVYTLPVASPVSLGLYDMTGRLVRTLVAANQAQGEHRTVWDGRDGAGSLVGSGMYLCRLTAGSATLSTRVVVIR
jgi:predicted outer membrane repeat protein